MLSERLTASWGSTQMVSRGRLLNILDHPGFIAESSDHWLGYANYDVERGAMEITVLEAIATGRGVGGALLAASIGVARELALSRVWLITTNDNTPALRFYQRRGFTIVALHREAVTEARRTLKPEIPMTGQDGIPLRDEIELELPRPDWDDFVARYGW